MRRSWGSRKQMGNNHSHSRKFGIRVPVSLNTHRDLVELGYSFQIKLFFFALPPKNCLSVHHVFHCKCDRIKTYWLVGNNGMWKTWSENSYSNRSALCTTSSLLFTNILIRWNDKFKSGRNHAFTVSSPHHMWKCKYQSEWILPLRFGFHVTLNPIDLDWFGARISLNLNISFFTVLFN